MRSTLHLLLACLAVHVSGQVCPCPLLGTFTETETPTCPTGNVFTITSISTVGACRNPLTTTTTTTRTAGQCNCPTASTTTETGTPNCPGVTSTSTAIQRTIDCPYAATVTQTVTRYGIANSTAYPTTGSGVTASTGTLAISTASGRPAGNAPAPSPTCSIDSLPDSFYIRDALSGTYLLYDPTCAKAIGCPNKADATPFHINDTDVDELGGVPQLSLFYPTDGEEDEYGAYVQDDGGPIQFFQVDRVPEEGDWYIVTASFSTYLCQLSLITWNLHDLSTPEVCGGYLALGYGFGEDECPAVKLIVEPA